MAVSIYLGNGLWKHSDERIVTETIPVWVDTGRHGHPLLNSAGERIEAQVEMAYDSIEPIDMSYNGPAPHCGYCYKTIHEPWCIYVHGSAERAFDASEREWLRQVNGRIQWPSLHTLFVIGGVIAWIVFLWRVLWTNTP